MYIIIAREALDAAKNNGVVRKYYVCAQGDGFINDVFCSIKAYDYPFDLVLRITYQMAAVVVSFLVFERCQVL